MGATYANIMRGVRGPAARLGLAVFLAAAVLTALGCGFGVDGGDRFGNRGRGPCVQDVDCGPGAYWDPTWCSCVPGAPTYADGGCVQTEWCSEWARWDPDRCRCEAPDASEEGGEAGACCPRAWLMYSCTFPDAGSGLACHNPALACASSLLCGQGCDEVVTGRCADGYP